MEPMNVSGSSEMNSSVAKPKYEKHEVIDAANTIMKAHEHMADPAMMKLVKPHLDKKVKAVRSIADLKKRAEMSEKMSQNEPNEGSAEEENQDMKEYKGKV